MYMYMYFSITFLYCLHYVLLYFSSSPELPSTSTASNVPEDMDMPVQGEFTSLDGRGLGWGVGVGGTHCSSYFS